MVETHPEKRLIGYARVSTYGQTLDNQLEQLRAAGCGSRNIYREKATGARADRRELNRMLGKLAPGDVVTVTRIDRTMAQLITQLSSSTLMDIRSKRSASRVSATYRILEICTACPSTVIAAFRAPALRCACIAPQPKTDVSGGAGIE
jgi:DNA invertase Pin-like site-specific DNA recombinase